MLYKSTMEYFKPMMRGLRRRNILPDLLAGIWMIVKAIAERNYLQASNIYMSLSVGELALPVTSNSCIYQRIRDSGFCQITVCWITYGVEGARDGRGIINMGVLNMPSVSISNVNNSYIHLVIGP